MIFLLLSVSGEPTCVYICAWGCGSDPRLPDVMPVSQLPGCPRHTSVTGLRTSVFQELCHPRALTKKAPTAQLTRIDAADRQFSVPLNTHNKCTGVSRFVRGIGRRVAELWVSVGLAEALDRSSRSDIGHQVPQRPENDDTSEQPTVRACQNSGSYELFSGKPLASPERPAHPR